MQRFAPIILLMIGLLAISSALLMAQDDVETPEIPEYAGTRECRDCHRDAASAHRLTSHAQTFVELEEDMEPDENPVVADFESGEAVRITTFPDGDERAFTMADVRYTLGVGRSFQAYVTELEEGQFYLLPAQWNAQEAAWVPLELGESWPDDAYAFGPNCAGCHTTGLNTSEYTWEEEGVMCETCHGPGLVHVEAADDAGGSVDDEERAEIYGSIHLALDSATCGQCHARGEAEDDIHPFPVGYYPDITTLDEAFDLVSDSSDDAWFDSGHGRLPNMQYNEAIFSGHPDSLDSAQDSDSFGAECLTCHSVTQQLVDLRLGNEDIDPATVDPLALAEANPYGVTCATCHDPHRVLAEDETPPDVPANLRQDNYTLCTGCHSDSDITEGLHYPVQQMFEGIEVVEGIEGQPSAHFSAEDGPTCTTCHMPTIPTYLGIRHSHTFQLVLPNDADDEAGLQDSCSGCHDEGRPQLQNLINDIRRDTRNRIEAARELMTESTPAWVGLALDFISGDGSAGIHNYAYADSLLDAVEVELGLFATESE